MIIVLSKDEDPELAIAGLKKILTDPIELERSKSGLFWQTDVKPEDLKLLIDIYVRR